MQQLGRSPLPFFLDAIAFCISNLIKRLYWRLLIVRVEKEMNYLWFIIFPILARSSNALIQHQGHERVKELQKE